MLGPLVLAAAVTELLSAAAIFWLVTILQGRDSGRPVALPDWLGWADTEAMVPAALLILAGLLISKNLLLAGTSVMQSLLITRSMASTFDQLVRRLFQAPYHLHPTRNSSEVVHAAFHGIEQAFRMVLGPAVNLFAEVFLLAGICFVLLWMTPWVSVLVGVVMGGTTLILLGLLRRPVLRWGRQNHDRGRELIGSITEVLSGQKEIRTMQRESVFHGRLIAAHRFWTRAHFRHAVAAGMPRLVIETVFILSAVVIFVVTTRLSVGSDELIPIAALFAYAGFRVIPGANRIALHVDLIRHGKPSVDRLSELLSTFEVDDALELPASGMRPRGSDPRGPRVDIDMVSYSRESTGPIVLENVSFRVGSGESLGVVGETGSGKSTLIDLIAGLLKPETGTIRVDGLPIRSWQVAGGRLGYVPQVAFLLDDSIANNVVMGDETIDRALLEDALEVARLKAFVDALPAGIDTVIGERGVRVSGGERQRIALARAFYYDPDLLLLDEATSALDYRTEIELGKAMDRQERNRTRITVAHRLESVRDCDRIIVLSEGKIVGEGTWDQLEGDNEAFRRLRRDQESVTSRSG